MKFCNTCNRAAATPFRVFYDNGCVKAGCVDAFHDGHLTPGTESRRWHDRPAARRIRAHARMVKTGHSFRGATV